MPKLSPSSGPPRTRLQQFQERWRAGCGSDDCSKAYRVCLMRGAVPADVLMIGEAPGQSENALGTVFIGPAGHLINRIVADAVGQVRLCGVCRRAQTWNGKQMTCPNRHTSAAPEAVRIAWTNAVGCLPRDFDGQKAGEPSEEQKTACKPRLEEFIALVAPRLIVCVGTVARDWLEQGYRHSVKLSDPKPKLIHVDHPAYILRTNIAQQGLLIQRCTIQIRNATEEL